VESDALTIVCAWCACTVRKGGPRLSHGICLTCAMRFLNLLPRPYLESIADQDGMVTLFSGVQLPVAAAIAE
jgi:hypothetical protein